MVGYVHLNVNSKPAISWELMMATKARGEVKTSGIIMNRTIGTKPLRP